MRRTRAVSPAQPQALPQAWYTRRSDSQYSTDIPPPRVTGPAQPGQKRASSTGGSPSPDPTSGGRPSAASGRSVEGSALVESTVRLPAVSPKRALAAVHGRVEMTLRRVSKAGST